MPGRSPCASGRPSGQLTDAAADAWLTGKDRAPGGQPRPRPSLPGLAAENGHEAGDGSPGYLISLQAGGEGGIRTPGTGFNPVQQISNSAALTSDFTVCVLTCGDDEGEW